MEVRFTPELQAKLDQIAVQGGRKREELVTEAVERFVDHESWFIRETEKGLAAADRSEFIEHEEIGKIIESRYRG